MKVCPCLLVKTITKSSKSREKYQSAWNQKATEIAKIIFAISVAFLLGLFTR